MGDEPAFRLGFNAVGELRDYALEIHSRCAIVARFAGVDKELLGREVTVVIKIKRRRISLTASDAVPISYELHAHDLGCCLPNFLGSSLSSMYTECAPGSCVHHKET